MAPTDEQRDQAWELRYTRQAIEADGRWGDDDFAALAALGAERDAERRRRIITEDVEVYDDASGV